MTGRKPIEKRLMDIEEGITEIIGKLCQISPCDPQEEDVVVEEES